MSDQDEESKTEEPTERRLEDARKKGELYQSKEVANLVVLLFLSVFVLILLPRLAADLRIIFQTFLQNLPYFVRGDAELHSSGFMGIVIALFTKSFLTLLLLFFALAICIVLAFILQRGVVFSGEIIQPKLERLSLLQGAKRLFSLNTVVENLKNIAKLSVFSWLFYKILREDLARLGNLYQVSLIMALKVILNISRKFLIYFCISEFFIAIIDFFYQKRKFMQKMRMTKYEVKKEFKEQEGSAEVKAKIRQIAQEKLRSNLSEIVPSASFVVTNPEHFAVALSYDPAMHSAPVVIAKGEDATAQLIRQIAREARVPVMEYPRVARKLYAQCKVGDFIPEPLYEDIAEIIRYLSNLDKEFAKKYGLN